MSVGVAAYHMEKPEFGFLPNILIKLDFHDLTFAAKENG